MRSSAATYFPRLDHLRFMAMLLVFAWHAIHTKNVIPATTVPAFPPLSLFEEGYTGVSLFLTLSGFVFASLCDGREVKYLPFIGNRLLRIAPLLVLWTLVRQKFPGEAWTLVVEFELYVIFPFLLMFARRYGSKYLAGLLVVALTMRGLLWVSTGEVQQVAYWTVLGRVDAFVLGMLAFTLSRRFSALFGHPAFFAVILTTWCGIYQAYNAAGGFFGGGKGALYTSLWIYWPTLEGLFYSTLAASYLQLRLPFAWPRASRFFAWLGTLTYSIYLNHLMVLDAGFKAADALGLRHDTPAAIVTLSVGVFLPLTIACSALTYYVVELPFLRLRLPYLGPRETPA